MAPQTWPELVAGCSGVRKVSKGVASVLDPIKKSVRILRTILGDIPPDVFEVAFRFRSLEYARHWNVILILAPRPAAYGREP
jgi:hypothetical protein